MLIQVIENIDVIFSQQNTSDPPDCIKLNNGDNTVIKTRGEIALSVADLRPNCTDSAAE